MWNIIQSIQNFYKEARTADNQTQLLELLIHAIKTTTGLDHVRICEPDDKSGPPVDAATISVPVKQGRRVVATIRAAGSATPELLDTIRLFADFLAVEIDRQYERDELGWEARSHRLVTDAVSLVNKSKDTDAVFPVLCSHVRKFWQIDAVGIIFTSNPKQDMVDRDADIHSAYDGVDWLPGGESRKIYDMIRDCPVVTEALRQGEPHDVNYPAGFENLEQMRRLGVKSLLVVPLPAG